MQMISIFSDILVNVYLETCIVRSKDFVRFEVTLPVIIPTDIY